MSSRNDGKHTWRKVPNVAISPFGRYMKVYPPKLEIIFTFVQCTPKGPCNTILGAKFWTNARNMANAFNKNPVSSSSIRWNKIAHVPMYIQNLQPVSETYYCSLPPHWLSFDFLLLECCSSAFRVHFHFSQVEGSFIPGDQYEEYVVHAGMCDITRSKWKVAQCHSVGSSSVYTRPSKSIFHVGDLFIVQW